jgi:bacterioferritin
MKQDPVVLGYLGRALSFELSAVQQYLSLARLLEIRGMGQAGEKFRVEAQEEMQHVEQIIARMLACGVAPNMSSLKPTRLNGALPQLLQHAADFEAEIVEFYSQAVVYCSGIDDHENRIFFEMLLRDEQHHAAELDAWRREILGLNAAGQS